MPQRKGISSPAHTQSSPLPSQKILFLWCQRSMMLNLQSPVISSALLYLALAGGLGERQCSEAVSSWAQPDSGQLIALQRARKTSVPLWTSLSCQTKDFSIQVLKTKWKYSTAVMSGDALRETGTGNCAEARNHAALGQMVNYKYERHLLGFETTW